MTFFLISLGLSLDTFAVSLASGTAIRKLHLHHAFKIAFLFGSFQALMLLVGWLTGLTIAGYIQDYSQWIASGLLIIVGGKMIYESTLLKDRGCEQSISFILILGLAFATSIDALSVGVSFSLLHYRILIPVLILGIVTFLASLSGIFIGDRWGSILEKKMAALGGTILLLIGLYNLIKHIT